MIYLASPYSHPLAAVREARFDAVCRAVGALMQRGHHVFSPIAHSHPVAERCDLPGDWSFWRTVDEHFIDRCDALWVLTLDGWSQSVGVTAEIDYARLIGLSIASVSPDAQQITWVSETIGRAIERKTTKRGAAETDECTAEHAESAEGKT